MSGRTATVGNTLAGGIQDVAALLPLIGTEQCETHVGSALKGGYLYAAATPLSIFGSLGIVKAGISILFSSISISIPKISVSFHKFKPTIVYAGRCKWLGAKMLNDAGFKLCGSVAPLIGMDGQRFRAETRLLEILEEKRIDDPAKVTVDWKSHHWNIMVIILTVFGAAFSILPYLALLLEPTSWNPTRIHLPWLYPMLRIVGSCCATVSCQFIMQRRVVSLMKSRIIFMTINQELTQDHNSELEVKLKNTGLEWDPVISAEQCLWSLNKVLSTFSPAENVEKICQKAEEDFVGRNNTALLPIENTFSVQKHLGHISIPTTTLHPDHVSDKIQASVSTPPTFAIKTLEETLDSLQQKHFPSLTQDRIFMFLLWITLGLSLPPMVAGYIGCFTLVSTTPVQGSGPLVWVGLEAALSILRIIIWASNPSFDEETEITIGLELSKHQPLVTTDDYNPHMVNFDHTDRKSFVLVPEHEFLEHITLFTGPLDQFEKADNLALYFTLTTDYGWDDITHVRQEEIPKQPEHQCLLMTVLDINMQLAVTVLLSKEIFHYFDVIVKYNTISKKLEGSIQSGKKNTQPWRLENDIVFHALKKYHQYIVGALNKKDVTTTATLPWNWDLLPILEATTYNETQLLKSCTKLPILTNEDHLYLNQGYEHQLKSNLVEIWSEWIVMDMKKMQSNAQKNKCYNALHDTTSQKGTWELTEVDAQLVWAWTRRELVLLELSSKLEDTLQKRMEICASAISDVRNDIQLSVWIRSKFMSGQWKRLEQERKNARKRMGKAMEDASKQAYREKLEQNNFPRFLPQWETTIAFIDNWWWAVIDHQHVEYRYLDEKFIKPLIEESNKRQKLHDLDRFNVIEQLRHWLSYENWDIQHENEEKMMRESVEHICDVSLDRSRQMLDRALLDRAYEYPKADPQATEKFVTLGYLSLSKAKACTAICYDARDSSKEIVCEVVAKNTTRSIIRVDPKILPFIPSNNHLFFLNCIDKEAKEPDFVQQNRNLWWEQQKSNSSTFYFTPIAVLNDGIAENETAAHIFVFLTTPSSVQIHLLHRGRNVIHISIQENGKELGKISDISKNHQLYSLPPLVFSQGRHELEVVPHVQDHKSDFYCLRDISVEIIDVKTFTEL